MTAIQAKNSTIRQGDLSPALVLTCSDANGPADLTTYTNLKVVANQGGAALFSTAATGSSVGVITRPWVGSDTAVLGAISIVVKGNDPNGKATTFPANGYVEIDVIANLIG